MVISFRVSCAFALLVCFLQVCRAQTTPSHTIVSGHIYYANGTPVEGALVDFRCFCATSGVKPLPTHSDNHGAFTLTYPAQGEGWLTASKGSEGFPDATIALYGRRSSPSYARVDLRKGPWIRGFDLHFDLPHPLLKLRIVENVSGLRVRDARILIAWPDHPHIMMSIGVESSGAFVMALPKHSVAISVSAPGLHEWRYRDQKTGAPFLKASGANMNIVAELQPSSTQNLPEK